MLLVLAAPTTSYIQPWVCNQDSEFLKCNLSIEGFLLNTYSNSWQWPPLKSLLTPLNRLRFFQLATVFQHLSNSIFVSAGLLRSVCEYVCLRECVCKQACVLLWWGAGWLGLCSFHFSCNFALRLLFFLLLFGWNYQWSSIYLKHLIVKNGYSGDIWR